MISSTSSRTTSIAGNTAASTTTLPLCRQPAPQRAANAVGVQRHPRRAAAHHRGLRQFALHPEPIEALGLRPAGQCIDRISFHDCQARPRHAAAARSCSANPRADGLWLYGASQGLTRVRPQPAKPPVSRVASPAPATRAVAAIWASKASIGRPPRRRAATISA